MAQERVAWAFEVVSDRPPSRSHIPVTELDGWWEEEHLSRVYAEWRDEQDREARDEVARFVERARRGECATVWKTERTDLVEVAEGDVVEPGPMGVDAGGGYRFVNLEEVREVLLATKEDEVATRRRVSVESLPTINAIADRWRRLEKVRAAAQLLEEAGEVEMARGLATRTSFTDLELEVIELLQVIGEI
jgi:hypothetical protein